MNSTGHQLRPNLQSCRDFRWWQLMCTRLESMLSTFTSVVRNFKVSLPNHYDPGQIAAYFDHRPRVLSSSGSLSIWVCGSAIKSSKGGPIVQEWSQHIRGGTYPAFNAYS